MPPLPRILALALFVMLAALVSLLAISTWRGPRLTHVAPGAAATSQTSLSAPAEPATSAAPPAMFRALVISHRYALGLGILSLALALALVATLVLRPTRGSESRAPFTTARQEMGALTRLAQTSVAREEELSRERSVRLRAEQDAQFQQQLLTRSLEEKIRLGRDLHDGIIQSLYAAGLTIESVRALLQQNPTEADLRLEQTRARINDTIRQVRSFISGLAAENLRQVGFAHAVESAISELRAARDVRFDIKIDDTAASHLTAEQTLETLQIIREAVSNALRHGGASLVTLRLHQGDQELCLLVQDNGVGFDANSPRVGGNGLDNMTARAAGIGASCRVSSQPGEGARVVLTLPLVRPTPA